MASPFLTKQKAVLPSGLLTLAQSARTPRVAIARAGAELPMQADVRTATIG